MAKKVQIPDNLYDEEPGAIQKLTGGVRPTTTAQTAPVEETKPAKNRTVKPTSFYLTDKQIRKLDDLAYTYNGRTGKRINRNDIIRHLVDKCDVGDLQGL